MIKTKTKDTKDTKKEGKLDGISTTFLKLGDTVYSLTKIEHPISDMEKNIKAYYSNLCDKFTEEAGSTLVQDVRNEWDTQISHINEWKNKNTRDVKLPANMFDKPCMYYQNYWWELRTIVYEPKVFLCRLSDLDTSNTSEVVNRTYPSLANIPHDSKLLVHTIQRVRWAVTLGYSPQANKIINIPSSPRTFHTLSHGQICLGNAEPKRIWAMATPLLTEFINKTNLFSPATRDIVNHATGESTSVNTLLKIANIISVVQEEETAWTTIQT
jgi:hypothetical protein